MPIPPPQSTKTEIARQNQLRSFHNLRSHLYRARSSARTDTRRVGQAQDHDYRRTFKGRRQNERQSNSQDMSQPGISSQIEVQAALKQLHGVVRKSLAARMTRDEQTQKLPDVEHSQNASLQSRKRRRTQNFYCGVQKKHGTSPVQGISSTQIDPLRQPVGVPVEIIDKFARKHLTRDGDEEHSSGKILHAQEEPHKHSANETTRGDSGSFQGEEEPKVPNTAARIGEKENCIDPSYC
jgi:hypothetical protein